MKQYFFFILVTSLILTLNFLSGCTPPEQQQLKTPQSPDPKLLELQQSKLEQIAQVEKELEGIQTEIQDIETELSKLVEMKALHNMTAEEIAASFKRPGLEKQLTVLKEQEVDLRARKLNLEEDLKMIDTLLAKE